MNWRLPATKQSDHVGRLINCDEAISFRLDGKKFSGVSGDTVFSAAVSSGFNSSGFLDEHPLGLDLELAPLIWVKHKREFVLANSAAFKILQDGEYFVLDPLRTTGPKNSIIDRIMRLLPFGKKTKSFNADFTEDLNHWSPAIGRSTLVGHDVDVAVVGGGVGGLKAAITEAKIGKSVLICERTGSLGGLAALFGSQVDGLRANERIPTLIEQLQAFPKVTIWLNCDVTQASVGKLEALRSGTDIEKPLVSAKIAAKKIILATGQKNMLPPFAGNRAVGTISVANAYYLARDFGVFPGKHFASFSADNVAYNLLLVLAKAGSVASKAIDYRLSPSSRFIEFLKAYGVTNMLALTPSATKIQENNISLTFKSTQSSEISPRKLDFDCLIVSNGWQPDLELWVDLGGGVEWDVELGKLAATGTIAGVELIGAVSDKGATQNDDNDQYESPPEPVSYQANKKSEFPVYLNSGRNFSTVDMVEKKGASSIFSNLVGGKEAEGDLGVRSDVLDFAALVKLGRLPGEAVSALVEEKCFSIQKSGREFLVSAPNENTSQVQSLVDHRFGPNALIKHISSTEGGLVRGAVLFETGTVPDARKAIGCVFEQNETSWIAVLSAGSGKFKSCAAMVSGRRISCAIEDVPTPATIAAKTNKTSSSGGLTKP